MNEYNPDVVYPPGETLEELLEERGIEPVDFAQNIRILPEHLTAIFDGSAIITPELAEAFVEQLGGRAALWLRKEQRYREYLAQKNPDPAA